MSSFVGRAAERASLREHLFQARSGSPRVVLIEGESGLGKTALVRRFLDELDDVRVLHASGDEDESFVGGGVLDQLARSAGVREWEPLAEGRDPDPVYAGTLLLDLIGRSERDTPVVLVCDDAHWADLPSLRALAFAFRRLVAERFLAVLPFRPEGGARLPAGLHRLAERDTGARLVLSGLESNDVRALARSMGAGDLSPREAERIREHTGGNPLHISALLDELDREALRSPPGTPLPAPRSFRALELARLAGLSSAARELVIGASVLGTRAKLADAVEVGDVADAISAADEAVASGFLEVEGIGPSRTVTFLHPLVRAAVYHDQGPAHRAELHARAATVASDEATVLRHREAAAAGPDIDLAQAFVEFAERRVAAGDVGRAARAFASAARLHPIRRRRERLVVESAACHVHGAEVAEALALSKEAQTFEDPACRKYMLSYPHSVAGRSEETIGLLTEAWEACDPAEDPRFCAYIAIRASTNLSLFRPTADVEMWARRAVDLDPTGEMAGNAMVMLATGLARAGQLDGALELVDRLRDRPGVSELARDRWLLPRGILRLWSDDLDGARADLARAADVTRRHGPTLAWLVALNPLADTEFRLGMWDDALTHAELAATAVADLDFFWLIPYLAAIAVLPLAARGEWEAAETHLQTAKKTLELVPAELNIAWTAHAGAHLAATAGDHERVLSELRPLLGLDDADSWDDPAVQPWRVLEADALVSLHRLDEAETVVARVEFRADERDVPSTRAAAARVRGSLLAARGETAHAREAFEVALGLAPANQPFLKAVIEMEFGSFLRRIGRRREAQAQLDSARTALDALRARPYVQRIDRELSALGLAPSRRRLREPTKLTPQETAIVHLATRGYTNREIATELVISVRTVEYHLTNAYQKLGVTSRRDLIKAHTEAP